MNNKHRKILAAIFGIPTPKNLVWADIETLLIAVGCQVIEDGDSRVGFKKDTMRVDFHRPHPGKEAKSYQIRDARQFLEIIGVKP